MLLFYYVPGIFGTFLVLFCIKCHYIYFSSIGNPDGDRSFDPSRLMNVVVSCLHNCNLDSAVCILCEI